ncbi:hypothetical protein KKF82_08980 [Patescibacteria group bacterium]|nr:hypothetical protein [Patescibacteria group bacterium]
MIKFSLKNPAAGAYLWSPVVYIGGGSYYPDRYLLLTESWSMEIANDGYVDFRCVLYNWDFSVLDKRTVYNLFVKNGHEYEYNWATNTVSDITEPTIGDPKFRNLSCSYKGV